MKLCILLLLGLTAVKADKIVGGYDAGGPIPYQAALEYSGGSIRCGGSLVAEQWVLSAAHCQGTAIQWHSWIVVLGLYNIVDLYDPLNDLQTFSIIDEIPNAAYDSYTTDNDIMLLKLDRPADLNQDVGLARLPSYTTSLSFPAVGTRCIVSGWGTTSSGGSLSPTLQEVEVFEVDQDQCRFSYRDALTDNMMCLGVPEGGKDSCQGDSGGPAYCGEVGEEELDGIVSWGFGCAYPFFPGVYTRVAVYRNWIDQNTGGATSR